VGRHIGPVCALCRREGEKLYLKGERCYSSKCAIERRNFMPGQHGPTGSFRRKMSDYAVQLREKQKARRIYGVFERQFRGYFAQAEKAEGVTGAALLQLLETRFDNVVYRLGFAASRKQARQLVTHGHFSVNGKDDNVPSHLLKPGDTIAVTEISRKSPYFQQVAKENKRRSTVEWLELNAADFSAKVLSLPTRKQIDTELKEQLIVEFYSR
jgi:small subunit ribosomal protein S4